VTDLAALHARLDGIFEARDRDFPRRDPANTAAMRAALAEYVAALDALRPRPLVPEPGLVAEARGVAGRPVFVCGAMKSGTTLLLELLDAHPELVVLPGDSHMLDPRAQARYHVASAAWWVPVLVNPRGQAPFWFLGASDAAYAAFVAWLEWWRAELPAGEPRSAFLAYVLALHCANPRRAPRPRAWVEKTPGNELRVRELLAWYPRARFLHVVRDPLENLASLKELFRQRGWRWKAWSAATHAWRLARALAAGARAARSLGPSRWVVVRYEELAADPRAGMKRVADVLDLGWDECLVVPTVNGEPSQPNSMYRERLGVRGAVLPAVAGRWRTGLTAREARVARVILAATARRWGYAWASAAR